MALVCEASKHPKDSRRVFEPCTWCPSWRSVPGSEQQMAEQQMAKRDQSPISNKIISGICQTTYVYTVWNKSKRRYYLLYLPRQQRSMLLFRGFLKIQWYRRTNTLECCFLSRWWSKSNRWQRRLTPRTFRKTSIFRHGDYSTFSYKRVYMLKFDGSSINVANKFSYQITTNVMMFFTDGSAHKHIKWPMTPRQISESEMLRIQGHTWAWV